MPNILLQLNALLTSQERKKLVLLLISMVVMALFEMISITLIFPFLRLITSPEIIKTTTILKSTYDLLHFNSINSFLVFFGVMVLTTLIISNTFSAFVLWRLTSFGHMRGYTLSKRLLEKYLGEPYSFFLIHNSAGLLKNLLDETNRAVHEVIIPLMRSASKIAMVFAIALGLTLINWQLAILTYSLFGGIYLVIFLMVRQTLTRVGRARIHANEERFKAANEAIGGIKEAKVIGCEAEFLKRFDQPAHKVAWHLAISQVIGQLPRYALEIIVFGSIMLIVIYFLVTDKGLSNAVPFIGLYAFSAYRLMPTLQEVFHHFSQIRFNLPTLHMLYQELGNYTPYTSNKYNEVVEKLSFKNALEIRNVTFYYPKTNKPVLKNFNLTIRAGTSVALVGSTGSGKTTIVDIILGLLQPQCGTLLVDNVVIGDTNLLGWQKNIGYVPQEIYISDDTVTKNIAFGVPKNEIDIDSVRQAAKMAKIDLFVDEQLKHGYDTMLGERGVRLSGGQKQRIGIARSLYRNPSILVFDEATSALDNLTEEHLFQTVNEIAKTKTIIMVAHRLSTVQNCDTIFFLKNGSIIAEGSYKTLLASSPEFNAMVGVVTESAL